ncbi:MAG: hypothetical protein R2684_09480 [Pyrinomonadaceae bacterium]
MKLIRSFLAANLIFTLVFLSSITLAIPTVFAQDSRVALQRGFRTGYSDGYMSGYRDAIENASKSYARHGEYKSADRAFNTDYGKLDDYKDGYQQGFEKGYDTGFTKQGFDATIPNDLKLRGVVDVKAPVETPKAIVSAPKTPIENNVAVTPSTAPLTTNVPVAKPESKVPTNSVVSNTVPVPEVKTESSVLSSVKVPSVENPNKIEPAAVLAEGDEIVVIPEDTELIIELIDEIDTKRVREGDSFRAKVSSPYEISGAIIEGRIAKNRRPGRLKRRAELLLSFDRIRLSETRWSNFNAIIVEVLPVAGDNVKRVDNEGTVAGDRPYKKDTVTLGGATGTGVVIGAVVGGPVGAAVGAGVGAAFGVGAVVVERGEWIKLAENQQLRIKTAYETQIR